MASCSSNIAGTCDNEQRTRAINTLGFAVCHTAAVAQSRTSLLARVIATLVLMVQLSSIWVKSSGTCWRRGQPVTCLVQYLDEEFDCIQDVWACVRVVDQALKTSLVDTLPRHCFEICNSWVTEGNSNKYTDSLLKTSYGDCGLMDYVWIDLWLGRIGSVVVAQYNRRE